MNNIGFGSRRGSYFVGVALAASFGCGSADDAEGPVEAAQPTHWTYEGLEGPTHWGQLDTQFATCESGHQQSPIDIPASVVAAPLSALTFDYAAGPATIVDNGHTVQVSLTEGVNELRIGDDSYSLVQFHFHAHSEHEIHGASKPLELHLVHRSASGALAVVGVLFDVGASNAALAQVFDMMPAATATPSALNVELDPSELLPSSHDGWTYSGSLTTPPCTEGVKWHVMSNGIQVSNAQLEEFTTRHEGSYRPVMENDSTITSGD
jgi:carbonic anhydrase